MHRQYQRHLFCDTASVGYRAVKKVVLSHPFYPVFFFFVRLSLVLVTVDLFHSLASIERGANRQEERKRIAVAGGSDRSGDASVPS